VCAACDDLNEQLMLTLPVIDQLYANMQSVVSQCDERCDVSCNNDRVDIFNCDSVDATVAITTRAQSKLNVDKDVTVDNVDDKCSANVTSPDDRACDSDVSDNNSFIDVDDVTSLQNECGIGNSSHFATEQKNDESLAHAFQLASQGKSNHLLKDELLYRDEIYCGQDLANLAMPKSRRSAVLKLAHDSSHFGGVRKFERIYWFWFNTG